MVRNVAHSFRQTRSKVSLKLTIFFILICTYCCVFVVHSTCFLIGFFLDGVPMDRHERKDCIVVFVSSAFRITISRKQIIL